jgi:hypothetical protein
MFIVGVEIAVKGPMHILYCSKILVQWSSKRKNAFLNKFGNKIDNKLGNHALKSNMKLTIKKLMGLFDFAMMLKFLLVFSKYFLKYLQSNRMFCSP